MNGQDFPTSIARNSPKHEFPQHQQSNDFHHYSQQQSGMHGGYPPGIPTGTPPPPQSAQQQDLTIDGIPNSGGGSGGPFPHRRSRASRTFKNPPQPHMCIREKTIDGKEVFINVLSWTRIANPDNPDAPIPLYGGMKVGKIPPGSPRAPPLVYAVMASPEVLKKAGRKCPDTPERMNLVDLMCEFVEAMNPTLHLSRKPEILKDRDLSGELKDVWSAVQACRDKGRVDSGPPENLVVYTEFGPETAPSYEQSQHQQQQQQQQQYHHQQHFPHHHQQQYQQHYGGEPFQHQQQPPHHQQQQPQSAITNNSSNSSSVEVNSSDSPDVPDCGTSDHQLDELCQEAEALKLSPVAKSNGLTLPTTTTTSPSGSAESTPATSPSSTTNPESNSVPAANAAASAPQQGNTSSSTSPTSPTTTTSTPVSPTTTTPSPATPQKESKNSSHFFPMFRSSKSSSSDKSADKDANNSSSTDQVATGTAAAANANNAQSDAPVKSGSKKSGLNFFRRNKTDSKKTDPPVTPTKQKDSSEGKQNLLDKLDESLLHHHHHHGGSNGTGEIIENNSATIVAK